MNKEAKWIAHPSAKNEAPYFRRKFILKEKPQTAELKICGLGYYEVYLNGQKPDDRLLTPPFTQYENMVLYDSYDIGSFLTKGENVIAVALGNGQYHNNVNDVIGFDHAEWNGVPRLLCELRVDGEIVLVSDTSFQTATGGITFNALRVGETFDAGKEPKGWKLPEYDAADWLKPEIVRPPGGVLKASRNLPVRVVRTLSPVSVQKTSEHTAIYDFGENITGFVRMKGKGKKGVTVRFRYSEKLDGQGNLDTSNIDIYVLHDTFQTDFYTFDGEESVSWQPKFVFHGFQYMEVFCEQEISLELQACVVHSDIGKNGFFRCSDELLNRIQENTCRSTLTNFVHMPMDCPHREKLGWTGDAQLSAEQTLFNHDAKEFYLQWLELFPYAQYSTGFIPATIPRPGCCYVGHDGPVWDAAMFLIPWNIYCYTADTEAIRLLYEPCKQYLEYAYSISENGIIRIGHGDWSPFGAQCPTELTSTAYYYIMAECAENFARILKNDEEENEFRALKLRIRQAFQREFVSERGVGDNSQCALAITLCNHLAPTEWVPSLEKKLEEAVVKANYHINGGILSAKFLLCALSEMGRHDLAMKIALQKDFPGWGYSVMQGATTLWESWDGKDSRNHHMFGTISEWFYKHILGLSVLKPGFESFRLSPKFDALSYAEGEHKTDFGVIQMHWEKHEGEVVYRISVPQGTTAEVTVPNGYCCEQTSLTAGEYVLHFRKTNEEHTEMG